MTALRPDLHDRVPITANTLPEGHWWELDGSCWLATKDGSAPAGWRWQPMNVTAFAKEGPDPAATMTNVCIPLDWNVF